MRRLALARLVGLVTACATSDGTVIEVTTTNAPISVATTAREATTTTSQATTTTLDEWESVKAWRGGPGGEYRTSVFEPAFRFTTPASLSAGPECADSVSMMKTQDDEFYGFLFLKEGHETVESAVQYWRELESLTLSDVEPTAVGGALGSKLTGSVETTFVISAPCGDNAIGFSPGTEMTLYLVDVNGQPVTIWVDEIPRVSDEDVQQFLDSIVWRDLT